MTDREALAILDVIDGIVDDTHPEGDGCPLCIALEDLRLAIEAAGVRLDRTPAVGDEGLRAAVQEISDELWTAHQNREPIDGSDLAARLDAALAEEPR